MVHKNRLTFAIAMMGFMTGCTSDVNFTSVPLISKDSTKPPINALTVNETYQVPKSPVKADIVFVVDGTPRMQLTIAKLQSRLDGFINSLTGADYQAGIMNSSMGAWDTQAGVFPIAKLMPLDPYPTDVTGVVTIVNNNLRNSSWILGRNLSFNGLSLIMNQNSNNADACDSEPYCAVGTSQPMNALKTFVNNSANASFFRPGAMFVPIIITAGDENDGATPVSVGADVQAAFAAKYGTTSGGMRAYSIIVQPNDATCLAQYSSIFQMGDGGVAGAKLDQFAKATGGASVSICGNDYTSGLAPITGGFSSGVTSITLQQQPLPGTLQIVSVPAASLQYTVSGTTVTFAQPLPWGASISISYSVKPQ
jgi:hypothetical protein